MKPYYKTLKIHEKATQQDIKIAYRILSKEWHPDKHNGKDIHDEAEKRFKEIGEAYEVLSDPEKRKNYDRTGLIEGSSLEDQAREQIIQVMSFAIECCVHENYDQDTLFSKVLKGVEDARVSDERKLKLVKNNLKRLGESLQRELDSIFPLKAKSDGDLYLEALNRIETGIEDKFNGQIENTKQEILLLENRIKIRELMIEILVNEYPKEPEKEEPEDKISDYYRDKEWATSTIKPPWP